VTDFETALIALARAGVNFIVVCAYAGVLQGTGQVTQDLDICYERTTENMKRLIAALTPYHPRLRGAPANLPFLFDERTLFQGMNFTLETDLGDIDLLGHLSGLGQFQEIAQDAISTSVFGVPVHLASLDALIRSKRAAGRPKDVNSLPELEALKELHNTRKDEGKR